MGFSLPRGLVSTTLLFGKLPAHGDFVARGLDNEARSVWDTGLTAMMTVAQRVHGDRFHDLFAAAPPWRCVLANPGGEWLGGALCPSLDSAGRLFPLLLARRCESVSAATGYSAGCEDLLFDALANGWTADTLLDRAEALTLPTGAEAAPLTGWWLDGHELLPRTAPVLDGPTPSALVTEMLKVTEQLR